MNQKTRGITWTFRVIVAVMSAFVLYGILIEPNQVRIHHVWIRDGYLGRVLKNKVVVQLSDLHISRIGRREQKALALVRELQPDIIFLTGDYVQWKGNYGTAIEFLSLLRAKIGVWAIMGDYDYSNTRKSCLFCHSENTGEPSQRHSVRFLKDESVLVKLAGGELRITGFDGEGGHLLPPEKLFLISEEETPTIILSHSPLNYDLINNDQKVLVLAGDTHGGQVPLPKWLFSAIGYNKNFRYNEGYYQNGKKKMYVSRGIGTSHIPIRLFRSPEVVVYHFQK